MRNKTLQISAVTFIFEIYVECKLNVISDSILAYINCFCQSNLWFKVKCHTKIMKSLFHGNKATGICTITQSSFTFKITIILVADTVFHFLAKVEKIELCGDRYIFLSKNEQFFNIFHFNWSNLTKDYDTAKLSFIYKNYFATSSQLFLKQLTESCAKINKLKVTCNEKSAIAMF